MRQLHPKQRARIFHDLMEGMSVRAASRTNEVAFNTVLKFTVDMGKACEAYLYEKFQNLSIEVIQADEVWTHCGCKQERLRDDHPKGWGTVFTWTSIDPVSRLMPVWHCGGREYSDAYNFIQKLRWAIKDQGKNLTIVTDGNRTYLPAIQEIFGHKVNYLHYYKHFYDEVVPEYRRYSMARMKSSSRKVMIGEPDTTLTTNHIEATNMMVRTQSRRFVRMTNGHSKKLLNHRYAFAMTMFFYNFCRVHSAIRCTPAMEAGLIDHIISPLEAVMTLSPYATTDKRSAA